MMMAEIAMNLSDFMKLAVEQLRGLCSAVAPSLPWVDQAIDLLPP